MKCPNSKCNSSHIVKAGFKVTVKGRKQRFQCQDCGRTFYENKEVMPSDK